MATDDAKPPTSSGGILTARCLIDHCFDLDEALCLPADIPRQVAESNSLVDSLPAAVVVVPSDGYYPCPICREGFPPQENTGKRVPCGHVYHAACISSWLSNSGDGSCPLCRASISAGRDRK
ncbi:unnamed protein product [Linum tenue]|uniref:RING-type E3 ubiquitin transferase n=1 Tax=Linum tenue TaxID=586396 RepID=A0AAV0QEE1_9ROSI|nr:unnamed protein product [Linum tenue]